MLSLLNFLVFLIVTGYALYLFVHVVYSRIMFIRLGKKVHVKLDLHVKINQIIINVFGHKKLLKDKKSGMMHLVFFYGFIIVQFGAIELIGKGLVTGWQLPLGSAHHYFSFFQEMTIMIILFAVGYAFYRRYVEKLPRLKRGLKAGIVLILITLLMLSVLISLAFETIILDKQLSWNSPISSFLALLFSGTPVVVAKVLFYTFWWFHLLILLSFMIYIPQSKHAHMLFAPYNWLVKDKSRPLSIPNSIDFNQLINEEVEEFGVGRVENFTRNQLIDLYACVECGRCTNVCPASATGKTLSPMHLITKMRDHLTEKGAAVTSRTPWMPTLLLKVIKDKGEMNTEKSYDVNLIGDVITEEELWACTTCRSCEEQCPVANEHVGFIIDMRRFLVLSKGKMSNGTQRALINIEKQGNPWGISRQDRIEWRENMKDCVPTVNEVTHFEYLLFVGSMGSYDSRAMKITKALVHIMNKAEISFAILGNEEKNSGDTARRLGNEMLFQELAQENIKAFKKYGVRKIVTIDPHAFNLMKNEYPEFGLEDVEVYHHTELLAKCLKEGKIKPVKELNERITYHDPCYLGRYNDLYDAPREILEAIPGVDIVEMEFSRENSMCCGAGGGMMWQEETQGKRVNIARIEQAINVRPTIVGSACPYCLTMLTDGIKSKELDDQVQNLDVAEILERAL